MASKLTLVLAAVGGLLAAGCSGNTRVEAPPERSGSASSRTDTVEDQGGSDSDAEGNAKSGAKSNAEGDADLVSREELAGELVRIRTENQELRQRLESERAERVSLEERFAALEIELASSVEEVLRSKASLRSVHNRALAISRIAEVRVQMQSVPQAKDREVSARLQRANEFLNRADTALGETNFGGASYLAERAADLIRQARMVAEVRSSSVHPSSEVIPIVPPRNLETRVYANLREAPGTDRPRVGQVAPGVRLLAVARWGEWFQVENDSGERAWIHESVVR